MTLPSSKAVKVSVIVPIYNVERFIERCARSLMGQTLDDIEYIFVDDCTPDNSIKVLDRILTDTPPRNVRIIRHDRNRGLAAARLTGLKAAQGDYVAHCDADDWVDVDMYAKMYAAAVESGADIVACGIYAEKEAETRAVLYERSTDGRCNVLDPQAFGWINGSVWNKLVRRTLYTDNDIYPIEGINMWEDSVLTMRLRWFSCCTVILPEALYHYWIGERQSVFFSVNALKMVDEMVMATDFLDEFFRLQGASNDAVPLLTRLRLLCKERLMRIPTREGLSKWRRIYPENDLRVWACRDYSFMTKVKITLLHFLPESMAWQLFRVGRVLPLGGTKRCSR